VQAVVERALRRFGEVPDGLTGVLIGGRELGETIVDDRRGVDPHQEDETFYVVEGEMTFSIGDETIKATAGTMVFAPREQVRILVMVAPAGAEGFFKECSVPAPSMTLPPPSETPYSKNLKILALAPRTSLSSCRQHSEQTDIEARAGGRTVPEVLECGKIGWC
jgi:hypothetical protein